MTLLMHLHQLQHMPQQHSRKLNYQLNLVDIIGMKKSVLSLSINLLKLLTPPFSLLNGIPDFSFFMAVVKSLVLILALKCQQGPFQG